MRTFEQAQEEAMPTPKEPMDNAVEFPGGLKPGDIVRLRAITPTDRVAGSVLRTMLLMPPTTPAEEASNTCDWGKCDELTTSWRWSPLLAKWIPVCHEHRTKTQAERVQELADEFRRLAAENEAAIEKNGVVSLGYRAIEFKSTQRTWEQAAQMLEERLNG